MDEDIIKAQWKQLRGRLKVYWGQLTDNDLAIADGNMEYLAGKLEERYGISLDDARKQIKVFVKGLRGWRVGA